MVCIYCGSATRVTNSRRQAHSNSIWRRRVCQACKALFTTEEHVGLKHSLMFQNTTMQLTPFLRDHLFVSILDSCKHRPQAVSDAGSLTEQIVTRLLTAKHQPAGLLTRDQVISCSHDVLQRFDATAAAVYAAFHPVDQ